jgi:hypothetical protein
MRTSLVMLLAGLSVVTAAVPVLGHHAFAAEFDATRPIKLRGTVTKMEWINPHTWIHIDVKKPNGKVERWMIEGGPPNALYRRGFTKDSLPEGTEILVEGFQAKDGSLKGNGRDLTLPDGRRLFLGSSGTGAPRDGRDAADK